MTRSIWSGTISFGQIALPLLRFGGSSAKPASSPTLVAWLERLDTLSPDMRRRRG